MILSIKTKSKDIVMSGIFSFNTEFDQRTNTNSIWYKKSDSPFAANLMFQDVLSYTYHTENGVLIKEETLC